MLARILVYADVLVTLSPSLSSKCGNVYCEFAESQRYANSLLDTNHRAGQPKCKNNEFIHHKKRDKLELHFKLCGVSRIIGHHNDTCRAAFHQFDRVAQVSPLMFRERRRYHRWDVEFVISKPEFILDRTLSRVIFAQGDLINRTIEFKSLKTNNLVEEAGVEVRKRIDST